MSVKTFFKRTDVRIVLAIAVVAVISVSMKSGSLKGALTNPNEKLMWHVSGPTYNLQDQINGSVEPQKIGFNDSINNDTYPKPINNEYFNNCNGAYGRYPIGIAYTNSTQQADGVDSISLICGNSGEIEAGTAAATNPTITKNDDSLTGSSNPNAPTKLICAKGKVLTGIITQDISSTNDALDGIGIQCTRLTASGYTGAMGSTNNTDTPTSNSSTRATLSCPANSQVSFFVYSKLPNTDVVDAVTIYCSAAFTYRRENTYRECSDRVDNDNDRQIDTNGSLNYGPRDSNCANSTDDNESI